MSQFLELDNISFRLDAVVELDVVGDGSSGPAPLKKCQ